MATHSGVLALRIPGTGEPGGLLSMGLHRVGHDGSNLAEAAAASKVQFYFNRSSLNSCNYDDNWSISNYNIIVHGSKVMASLPDSFLAEKFKEPRARGVSSPFQRKAAGSDGCACAFQPTPFGCCVLIVEWFPTLCNPFDCRPLDSSVHGFPRQEYQK